MKNLVCAACLAAASIAAAQTIAFWPFGDRGLNDASGNGNTLAADANVTIGETAALNGAQTLFSTVNALNLSACEAVTVEFWVKFNAADNPGTVFFLELSPQTASYNGAFYLDYNEASGAVMGMYKSGKDNSGAEESPVRGLGDGAWHHIAFVMRPRILNETCSTLYIDREHVYTHCYKYNFANSFGYTAFPSNQKLFIGSRNNASLKFKGEIDNIRVSGMALSPWAFLNRDGTSGTPPVVAYWPFGSAGAADMSGHGHDLLVETGATFTNGAVAFAGSGKPLSSRLPIDLRPYTQTGLTAEFWMRMPAGAAAGGSKMLLECSPSASAIVQGMAPFYVDVGENATKIRSMMRMDVDNAYHIDESTTAVVDNAAWHHVAFVYDPLIKKGYDTVRLYLDGTQLDQNTTSLYCRSNLTALAKSHLFLGGRAGGTFMITGELDDVRLTAYPLQPGDFLSTRTEEDARVAGWWQFCRAAPTASARAGLPALVASGSVVYSNGVAVLAGGASLAPAQPLDLGDAAAVTAECFVNTDGTWRHLVKTWGDGLAADPTAVTLDGVAVASADWTDVLTFTSGAFTAAGTGFVGQLDDVRVTAAAPGSFATLPAHSDDTPFELAHWSFSHQPGLDDETGVYGLAAATSPSAYSIYDSACSFSRCMGLRTVHPLQLARWPSFTIECFARFDPGRGSTIFELGDNYNSAPGTFCLSASMFTTSGPGFGFRTAEYYNIRTVEQPIADGAWHHYACVVDRSGGTTRTAFYVDGVSVTNSTGFGNTAATTFANANLSIGARWGVGENASWNNIPTFVGDVDELRIVNAALAPSEMMTLASRTSQQARTLAHWTFEGEQPLADVSGNGHDLTGSATVSDGVASFANGASLRTAAALPLASCRQLTVEMLFRRTAPISSSAMLYETGLDYNNTPGTICSYLNSNNNSGSLDIAAYGLARRSDLFAVADTRWHRLVVWYDMDAPANSGLRCTGTLDAWGVTASTPRNDMNMLRASTSFSDQILYLGSRGGTQTFFTGEIKEMRISEGLVHPRRLLACPATETADHVVAYWPFSGVSRGLQDATGNGHDLIAAPTGVSVSAKEDYVDFAAGHGAFKTASKVNFSALDAFTVECFVRMPDNDGTQSYGILGTAITWAEQKTGFNLSMTKHPTDTNARIGVGAPVCGGFMGRYGYWIYPVSYLSGGVLTDRRWHHLALVIDRTAGAHGRAAYYCDGQLQQQTDFVDNVTFAADRLCIGSLEGGGESFVGQIDDVRISSAALTPAQFLTRRSLPPGCMIIVR